MKASARRAKPVPVPSDNGQRGRTLERVDDVVVEDPPPRARYRWATLATDLRVQPDVWVRVGVFEPRYADRVARQLRHHGCRTATRVIVTGRETGVWARFDSEATP